MGLGVKEQLLAFLEDQKGEILSGAELSQKLQVSRTAIWKAVSSLRAEGYDIEAIKKTGYRLHQNSDILSVYKILDSLEDLGELEKGEVWERPQVTVQVFKTVDSTNQQAKLAAIEGALEGLVIASEEQSRGKGHRQRKFCSPAGKGAYFSVLLRPKGLQAEQLPWLSRLAALAVVDGIEEQTGVETEIRLPNDVVYRGKKLCGILTEAMVEGESGEVEFAVIGVGISVYEGGENADPALPLSLHHITGSYCNRSELMGKILKQLFLFYQCFCSEGTEEKLSACFRSRLETGERRIL